MLLANTYHLLLRPGVEIFEKFGGIHGFMNWPRSVLTDSGGFQIFSLPNSRSMREDGAEFRSYIDQRTILLSPERSIATQKLIGSDIMMVLDQCVPSTVERSVARDAMELTHRWAQRSLEARGDSGQALFGIVQGACYDDLRVESARTITQLPFDGFAIGGPAIGESISQRDDCTAIVTEHLPLDRPRYLMGVSTPRDLLEAVHHGVDMFDCILPTSMAQQGVAFTSIGRRSLKRAAYLYREGPLDPSCTCYTCRTHSIAYLFHLQRTWDSHGAQLLGLHNLHFYMQLMRGMREHILAGDWLEFLERLEEADTHPLVVWDVGLGAGTNAMATIRAVEAMDQERRKRRLVLVSFENDLDSLRLALRHPLWFKHLHHAAPHALLAKNQWLSASGAIDWLLLQGDFAALKFDAPVPDVIYFDPFSFKAGRDAPRTRVARCRVAEPLAAQPCTGTAGGRRRRRMANGGGGASAVP